MSEQEQDYVRIRSTWAAAASDPSRLASLFYAHLFRIDETTRPLFVGDLVLQGRKLAQTLNFIVDNLHDQEILVPAAKDLAIRHLDYGVTAAQYGSVGSALIETLSQLLGSEFTEEDQHAWQNTYTKLASVMVEAAYQQKPA
ncbi:MAG: globin domain-containing protein [Pseudomonadota bacterium]